jgi:hypothetical protein
MKIGITKDKNSFYIHFNKEPIFTATPSGVCVMISKTELETLIAFAQAELQEYLIGVTP